MSDTSDSPVPRGDTAAHSVGDPQIASAAGGPAATSQKAAKVNDYPHYSLGEEIFNAVSHGVGALLAIAALVLLIVRAALGGGGALHVASAVIYGVALILEYLASTLYHAIPVPACKRVFRLLDHSCIYLLIAGTYTPFLLITLHDCGGVAMCVFMWVMAALGIIFELVLRERQPRWLSITIYLVMGWLIVFRLPQLIAALPLMTLILLAVGGLCYTAGVPFYLAKKVPYLHSVFHLWVLAGSIFQFMAVILFVI